MASNKAHSWRIRTGISSRVKKLALCEPIDQSLSRVDYNSLVYQDNGASVILADEITIQTVPAAYEKISDALGIHSNIVIELDKDAIVDLTLVQLLEASRRSASEAGGSLTLSAPATGGLADVLRRGGFLQTAEQRAFWLLQTGER